MTEHSHSHSNSGDVARQPSKRIAIALGVTLAFVGIEAFAGQWAKSLALLSDAGHNLTDVIALGLSWFAIYLSAKPAHARQTFGYHRAGILIALLNSSTLIFVAVYIFYEAYQRFLSPPTVDSGILIAVGIIAVFVNLGTALLVKRGSEHDLNLRSAFVHLMGDVLSTVGAVIAGILIALTGMNWLDPLVSVLIALLILWNAWGILGETVGILLESTPRDVDISKLVVDLAGINGVRGVHDLHIWSITKGLRALSAHIVTDDASISSGAAIQKQINELVSHKYSIGHATLQLECVGCEPDLLYCDMEENGLQEQSRENER